MIKKLSGILLCLASLGGCVTENSDGPAATERAAGPSSSWATTIELDKPVHFTAKDGDDVLASAGTYGVESADQSQLRLIPEKGSSAIVVVAASQVHDIDISAPFVLAFVESEDKPHVLLLLPDGRALDAVGSFSGVQSRDLIRTNRLYTLQAETGAVRFGDSVVGKVPSAGTSSVSSSYRTGVGTLSNAGSSENLMTIQLQTLMADRQRAVSLSRAIQSAQTERFRLEYNWDRPGDDYAQRAERTPESCRTACAGDPICQAFTFLKPAAGASAGQCFLKRTAPASVTNSCCISGKRKSAQEELIGNIR